MSKFNIMFFVTFMVRLNSLKSGARWLTARLFTSLLIVAALIFVVMFIAQSFHIREMQAQFDQKKAEFALVQDRNLKLKQHLEFLNSPGYMLFVEKVAREKLGLAKPDETVILPVYPAGSPMRGVEQASVTAQPNQNQNKPIWQAWFNFFFGS